jgi:malate dehydrogenase (oxaloacetate-decarboxylating)(NADP+)
VQAARSDAIFGTGRSDYPNQVNNVLGFPFIFRGALDVRARAINMEMKMAATRALAALAREDVPDSVIRAYGLSSLRFGREYIIPKPLDPRVMMWIAPAVARAAMESGVARRTIDLDEYLDQLAARLGASSQIMRVMELKAQKAPKRIVFAEGEHPSIVRAAHAVAAQGIGTPILLGRPEQVQETIAELGIEYAPEVIDPSHSEARERYAELFHTARRRKGITLASALELMRQPNFYGPMMVKSGEADTYISGLTYNYPAVLRPALQTVGARRGRWVSGVYVMLVRDRVYLFTDATVIIEPTAEQLAAIALNAAELAERLGLEPRIAMLSFSNFGGTPHPESEKVKEAVALVQAARPDLPIDGEMQADVAVTPDLMASSFGFSKVQDPNILVFPNLSAANTAYKLLSKLGDAVAIGPILVGMNEPVHVLATGDDVRDIVNMATIAVVDAQAFNHDGGAE